MLLSGPYCGKIGLHWSFEKFLVCLLSIHGRKRDIDPYSRVPFKNFWQNHRKLNPKKARLSEAEEKNIEFEEYKVAHTITESMRRQAEMEIAHGESFRHDAQRVKSLEKELDR